MPRLARLLLLAGLAPVLFVCLAALCNGRVGADTDFRASLLLADPPPALAEPVTLKVVTFNIAAGYLFTGNRPERMRAVAERLWEGDWWAGKGVGLARVELPGGSVVDFFDTHAQAGRGNPENEPVRLGQMEELAGFVNAARSGGALAFVVGDFNTRPGRSDYELAVREAGLERVMALDSRIDHVFAVRDPSHRLEVLDTVEIRGTTRGSGPELFLSRPPWPREVLALLFGPPGPTCLSDHPGYMTTVRIHPRSGVPGG